MVPKTQLSIQDYFQHAGIGGHSLPGRITASTSNSSRGGNFMSILDNLQTTTQQTPSTQKSGMNISDYRQRAIPARMPTMPATVQDTPAPVAEAPVQLPESDPGRLAPIEPPAQPDTAGPATAVSDDDRINASIQAAAAKYNLPANIIHSVIRAESNFQPQAVSRAGAQGLMQLMPATAEELGVEDPFDIEQNIDGGTRYLRQMMDRFGGDLKKALAAYNAGPGTVMRYDGDVPYAETRNYVQKVLGFSRQYRV